MKTNNVIISKWGEVDWVTFGKTLFNFNKNDVSQMLPYAVKRWLFWDSPVATSDNFLNFFR